MEQVPVNRVFIFGLLFAVLSVPSFAVHVAVLETISSQNALGLSERQYLTDELRAQAVKALPAELNFTIMTRENIIAMLPPGKSIEECEGSCLVETGKNISADYVAQGRVGRFGKDLTLTVELYETAGAKLVGSFTAKSADAEGLLESVKLQSPELFAKVRGTGAMQVKSGISGFSGGQRPLVVHVNTSPVGAMLSVDGRPVTACHETPCDVQVMPGDHRFLVALDDYDDFDSVYTVSRNAQTLQLPLSQNFGTLVIAPVFRDYARESNLYVKIDGNPSRYDIIRLAPGNHLVEISHPCYEPVKFNAGIVKGDSFRFDSALVVAVGELSLKAEMNGTPQIVPVWVNGKEAGSTPYLGEVPLCAKIALGEDRNPDPVKLKYHETVKYTQYLKGEASVDASGKTIPQSKKSMARSAAASVGGNKDPGHHIKIIPTVLMALGAASLGAGVYEYLQVKKERKKYDDLDYPSQSKADSQWDKVQQAKNLQYGFYGAGAVLLCAGLVWTIAF